MMRATALFHVAEQRVECREVSLAPPVEGEVLIASRHSAISPGTEALIFNGQFPRGLPRDKSIESLAGGFDYPFTYGYALVGEVLATGPGVDREWVGRTVFAFHPHQDKAVVRLADCHPVPNGVEPRTALFLPQVETALNFVMDGAPLAGERVLVFGQGVVGLLTAALLNEFPLARLVVAEPLAWRRALAGDWGIPEAVDPTHAQQWHAMVQSLGGADLVFELSGDMAALDACIEAAGFDARIVVGSWYGASTRTLDLGGHFHRNRIRLISSQVSTLSPALTGRWDKRRRIDFAWRTMGKLAPQRLISRSFPFAACQRAFEVVRARPEGVMQVILDY